MRREASRQEAGLGAEMAWQLNRKRVSTYGKARPWLKTLPGGPVHEPKGYRGWMPFVTSSTDAMGYLIAPRSVQDTARSVRHEAQREHAWKTP